MAIEPTQFRQLVGNFATGCTVVTINSDPPHGLTANAFASVSLEPPLVLVCVDHDTESYEFLSEGGADSFCVNILTEEQQDIAESFAGMSDLDDDPFDMEATFIDETGAAVFEESLAYLDCSVYDAHEAGDHTIYVGEVKSADALQPTAEPLVFYQGGWGTVAMDGR